MNICVISEGYPYKEREEFVFVEQLCNQLSIDNQITVITPQSITKRLLRRLSKVPFMRIEQNGVTIYSPQIVTFGTCHFFDKILVKQRQIAISRIIKNLQPKPDIIYGHFWHSGYAAFPISFKLNIPLVVASGESEIEQRLVTIEERRFVDYVRGVICVSTKNLNESIDLGLLQHTKSHIILPNAIDSAKFRKLDKTFCRQQLNLPSDKFIVVFVGGFIYRKGPDRVSAAIDLLNDKRIGAIFIGTNRDGECLLPNCSGIIHCGSLKHDLIPLYLNASDVFVLPTLHEGCCNAIVEAMSCGLPIISSNLEFNKDILDESNAILINPLDVNEIAAAINTLIKDSDLREKMSKASLSKAEELTLEKRVAKITNFIREVIKNK